MEKEEKYTARLQAGLGMIDESLLLLDLWKPGMTAAELFRSALASGLFPSVTARRLRNLVAECFAPRFLEDNGHNAELAVLARPRLGRDAISQLFLVFACRANIILRDFLRTVYWGAYAAGRTTVTKGMALSFVEDAVESGRTTTRWSESSRSRVAGYLTGACADFGLLEQSSRPERLIQPCRLDDAVAILLAYDLHFSGMGDNAVAGHPDWGVFGFERQDVVSLLRRLASRAGLIVQSAGEAVDISWGCNNMKEVSDVLT